MSLSCQLLSDCARVQAQEQQNNRLASLVVATACGGCKAHPPQNPKDMEVLVEAATQVPQGCFVSVRLGDNLKQHLGCSHLCEHVTVYHGCLLSCS